MILFVNVRSMDNITQSFISQQMELQEEILSLQESRDLLQQQSRNLTEQQDFITNIQNKSCHVVEWIQNQIELKENNTNFLLESRCREHINYMGFVSNTKTLFRLIQFMKGALNIFSFTQMVAVNSIFLRFQKYPFNQLANSQALIMMFQELQKVNHDQSLAQQDVFELQQYRDQQLQSHKLEQTQLNTLLEEYELFLTSELDRRQDLEIQSNQQVGLYVNHLKSEINELNEHLEVQIQNCNNSQFDIQDIQRDYNLIIDQIDEIILRINSRTNIFESATLVKQNSSQQEQNNDTFQSAKLIRNNDSQTFESAKLIRNDDIQTFESAKLIRQNQAQQNSTLSQADHVLNNDQNNYTYSIRRLIPENSTQFNSNISQADHYLDNNQNNVSDSSPSPSSSPAPLPAPSPVRSIIPIEISSNQLIVTEQVKSPHSATLENLNSKNLGQNQSSKNYLKLHNDLKQSQQNVDAAEAADAMEAQPINQQNEQLFKLKFKSNQKYENVINQITDNKENLNKNYIKTPKSDTLYSNTTYDSTDIDFDIDQKNETDQTGTLSSHQLINKKFLPSNQTNQEFDSATLVKQNLKLQEQIQNNNQPIFHPQNKQIQLDLQNQLETNKIKDMGNQNQINKQAQNNIQEQISLNDGTNQAQESGYDHKWNSPQDDIPELIQIKSQNKLMKQVSLEQVKISFKNK